MVLAQIIIATIIVSVISLVGVLLIRSKNTDNFSLILLISFATGTLLASAFLDLLPEATEKLASPQVLVVALLGILAFFILEKFIFWHHHHHHHDHDKASGRRPLGYLNLIGDGLHNFFDGAAIAASFMASPEVGIATTIAVVAHEIPQELGDFSLLLYSGFTKAKALMFNFMSAILAVLGGVLFFYFSTVVENLEALGLSFTAGMFIYIAGTDLLPELFHNHKTEHKKVIKNDLLQTAALLLGIVVIYIIGTVLKE